MKLVGSIPGPNGRFVKGGKSYGGPGRKFGACMVGDKPLTPAERVARYRTKNPAAAYAAKVRWQERNPEKHRTGNRRRMLRKYGLTPESYDAMWAAQGNQCAVCQSPDPRSKKGWQIDHCHATNKVRGILCTHCNRMLAGALDKTDHLYAGISYLHKASEKKAA